MRNFGEKVFKWRGAVLCVPAAGLIILGKPSWASALVGVPIVLLGEALRLWSVGIAGATTRNGVLQAPFLATGGPYAYSRNPIYTGNFISGLGYGIAFTGGMSPLDALALVSASLALMTVTYSIVIPTEEHFLLSKFGPRFKDYANRVPRLFPRLRPIKSDDTFSWEAIRKAETNTFITIAFMLSALLFRLLRG